jgi:hypothetical protein
MFRAMVDIFWAYRGIDKKRMYNMYCIVLRSRPPASMTFSNFYFAHHFQ